MTPPNRPPNMTPEEAIFDVRERMVRMETLLVGVPDTADKGLVGKVNDNCEDLDATRKKVGRLEIRFWILIAFLAGSGAAGGTALVKLIAASNIAP